VNPLGELCLILSQGGQNLDRSSREAVIPALSCASIVIHSLDVCKGIFGHIPPGEVPISLLIIYVAQRLVTFTLSCTPIVANVHIVSLISEHGHLVTTPFHPFDAVHITSMLEENGSLRVVEGSLIIDTEQSKDI